jgi:sensor histidine kinase YesM
MPVFLNKLQEGDSTIYAAWSYENKKFAYSDSSKYEVYREEILKSKPGINCISVNGPYKNTDNRWVLSMYVSIEDSLSKKKYIGIDVDLLKIHSYVAYNSDLLMAYITIVSEGMKYIYHPEEKYIGMNLPKTASYDNIREAFVSNTKSEDKAFSDYLQIDTYRYNYPVNIGANNKCVITANVPNIGFLEFIDSIGIQMMVLAVLALLSFIFLFYAGVSHWRREFIAREEMEKDNLVLQLENEQQHKDSISRELENLKSGLNPHFLFNSLSSLMILVKRDAAKAGDFALSLSHLYRYLLECQNTDLVSLKDELDFAENYVFLQQIRFKDKLFVTFSLPEESHKMKVPPISLQTLVENAIKHNQISKDNPLHVKVYIKRDMLVIENNLSQLKSNVKTTRKGHNNLISRYKLLSNKTCNFYKTEDKYFAEIPLL